LNLILASGTIHQLREITSEWFSNRSEVSDGWKENREVDRRFIGPYVMIDPIVSRCSTHGLLLYFILLHISNSSVSTSLVGHVLYSADLVSATCIPHLLLMVHRYIYNRYSSVFLTLYQLYHSLPSSTLISSSSLYLKLQPKLLLKVITPYRIKKIISSNTVELEIPSTIKIYPVVNVSRICKYVGQVKGQKREQPAPVIIEGEEWEVERILNKQWVRGKDKYLVCWKEFMAESNTWEGRENLKNTKEAIEEFEKEYWR